MFSWTRAGSRCTIGVVCLLIFPYRSLYRPLAVFSWTRAGSRCTIGAPAWSCLTTRWEDKENQRSHAGAPSALPCCYFPNFIAYLCNENNLQVSTTGGQHQPRQLACDPLGSACLLLGPGHVVGQCSGASSSPKGNSSARLLLSDIDALAISAGAATEGLWRRAVGAAGGPISSAPSATAWVVLSSTYGVVEVAGGEGTEAAAAHRVAGKCGLTPGLATSRLLHAPTSRGC